MEWKRNTRKRVEVGIHERGQVEGGRTPGDKGDGEEHKERREKEKDTWREKEEGKEEKRERRGTITRN